MDKIKIIVEKFRSRINKKLLIAIVAVAVVGGAVLLAYSMRQKPYEVMFNGISSEEAKQIIGKLQEDGTAYQYRDGDILVPAEQVDAARAKLVSEGYPKSGFTFDVFKDNVSLMTTDADRRTFELYELETRIGSTIQVFKGVQDAYVTIALGETSKYALSDEQNKAASAQAVVVMKDGSSPSEEQAESIRLLISRSIPGLVLENVSVFDGNGKEVSSNTSGGEFESGKKSNEIAYLIEDQIMAKIVNVLGPIYGNGNVRVSVKGVVDMEKLIRESTTYNTPEKIDEKDKTGLISEENISEEKEGGGTAVSGAAGTETNADISQYNTAGANGNNGSSSSNQARKYVLNQIREQGEVSPGTLKDLTVSIVINGTSFGTLTADQIKELAGNAAGIKYEDRGGKITAIAAPFFTVDVPEKKPDANSKPFVIGKREVIIIAAAGGIILLILILFLIIRSIKKRVKKPKKSKKKKGREKRPLPEMEEMPIEVISQPPAEPEEDRGAILRDEVRDFAGQNPEISAQLLKSWLNGGGEDE